MFFHDVICLYMASDLRSYSKNDTRTVLGGRRVQLLLLLLLPVLLLQLCVVVCRISALVGHMLVNCKVAFISRLVGCKHVLSYCLQFFPSFTGDVNEISRGGFSQVQHVRLNGHLVKAGPHRPETFCCSQVSFYCCSAS